MPGTYLVSTFKPPFTITIPDGFTLVDNAEAMFWVNLGAESDPEFAVIHALTQKGVIKALAESSAYKVTTPVAVKVGGLDATAIDVEVPEVPGGGTPGPGLDAVLLNFPDSTGLGSNTWFVTHPRKVHLIELTIDGATIVVTYDAPPADYAAYEKIAAPIVESISF